MVAASSDSLLATVHINPISCKVNALSSKSIKPGLSVDGVPVLKQEVDHGSLPPLPPLPSPLLCPCCTLTTVHIDPVLREVDAPSSIKPGLNVDGVPVLKQEADHGSLPPLPPLPSPLLCPRCTLATVHIDPISCEVNAPSSVKPGLNVDGVPVVPSCYTQGPACGSYLNVETDL